MGDFVLALIVIYLVVFAIPHFLNRNLPGLLRYYKGYWIFVIVLSILFWAERLLT